MKTEPDAAMRQFASTLWQMFVALVDAGFSENQALLVVGQVIISNNRPPE